LARGWSSLHPIFKEHGLKSFNFKKISDQIQPLLNAISRKVG
jgi:hypothetical protein